MNPYFYRTALLMVLISGIASQITQLDSGKNVKVPFTFGKMSDGKFYESGELILGWQKSDTERKDGTHLNFVFKTYGDGMYVFSGTSDAQFNCNDDNGCTVVAGAPVTCAKYFSPDQMCQTGKTLVRFEKQILQATQTYGSLDINLLQVSQKATDSWNYPKFGVIAMGPKSAAWDFIETTYEAPEGSDYIETSFYISGKGAILDESQADYSGSSFIFNGRKEPTEPILYVIDANSSQTKNNNQAWVIDSINIQSNVDGLQQDVKTCIVNDINSLFMGDLTDNKSWAYKLNFGIMSQICPGVTKPEDCNSTFSGGYDITKVKDLVLAIKNKDNKSISFTFKPADYIKEKVDDKQVKTPVPVFDTSTIPYWNDLCQGSDVALGRLMLLKAEFVVRRFIKTDKAPSHFEIGFNETGDKDDKSLMVTLVILAILLLAITISIIFLKTCKREKPNNTEEDENYTKQDAQDF